VNPAAISEQSEKTTAQSLDNAGGTAFFLAWPAHQRASKKAEKAIHPVGYLHLGIFTENKIKPITKKVDHAPLVLDGQAR
jgi:hypothetical protein